MLFGMHILHWTGVIMNMCVSGMSALFTFGKKKVNDMTERTISSLLIKIAV